MNGERPLRSIRFVGKDYKDGIDGFPLPSSGCLPLREYDAEALPVLLELLSDSNPTIRAYAVDSLACLGSRAFTALPALAQLLMDENTGYFGLLVGELAKNAIEDIVADFFHPQYHDYDSKEIEEFLRPAQ